MAQVNTVIFEFSISLACWDMNWIQLNLSAKELQLNSVNFWLRKLQQDLRWIRLPENISHYPASVACLQRVCSYRCFSSFITIICLLISLGVWINGSFDILWLRTSIDEFKAPSVLQDIQTRLLPIYKIYVKLDISVCIQMSPGKISQLQTNLLKLRLSAYHIYNNFYAFSSSNAWIGFRGF